MRHILLLLILITFNSCSKNIETVKPISIESAKQLPLTSDKNNIKVEKVILNKQPQLVTYLPKGIEVISTANKEEVMPIHIFRKDANTTLSITQLAFNKEKEAQQYMKEILEYSANNVTLQENGFYAGESKGTYQQAKLLTINGKYFMWMVDCIEFQKENFLPIVNVIVEHTQFIEGS